MFVLDKEAAVGVEAMQGRNEVEGAWAPGTGEPTAALGSPLQALTWEKLIHLFEIVWLFYHTWSYLTNSLGLGGRMSETVSHQCGFSSLNDTHVNIK